MFLETGRPKIKKEEEGFMACCIANYFLCSFSPFVPENGRINALNDISNIKIRWFQAVLLLKG